MLVKIRMILDLLNDVEEVPHVSEIDLLDTH